MESKDVEALVQKVEAELAEGLKTRAMLDDQIAELMAKRKEVNRQIGNARAMLKFASLATPDKKPTPLPMPVETAALLADEAAP